MSRYTKVAPGGRSIVLDGGYHLCARCGTALCTDDRVVVVYRAPWWGVYTHLQGPDCPAKAVSGWRAVERALDMLESNIPTPREAYPVSICGFALPFVSLLDCEHCNAEMAAVTISQKDFLPITSAADVVDDDSRRDLIASWGDLPHRREWHYRELKIVEALDRGVDGAFMAITRDVLQRERASLYVKCNGQCPVVSQSEKDERPVRTTASLSLASGFAGPKSSSRDQHYTSRRSKVAPYSLLSYAFTRDAIGKPGEYALYSQKALADGRRVLEFGGNSLDEFSFYQLSGPKPVPLSLPFDSARCPEMFDWSDDYVPKGLVEHWKCNPKSSPYGPVARLKPALLAALRNSK